MVYDRHSRGNGQKNEPGGNSLCGLNQNRFPCSDCEYRQKLPVCKPVQKKGYRVDGYDACPGVGQGAWKCYGERARNQEDKREKDKGENSADSIPENGMEYIDCFDFMVFFRTKILYPSPPIPPGRKRL